MNSEKFCYWLQGFAELNDGPPTKRQWESIKEHLGLVFNKVTIDSNRETELLDRIKDLESDLSFIKDGNSLSKTFEDSIIDDDNEDDDLC